MSQTPGNCQLVDTAWFQAMCDAKLDVPEIAGNSFEAGCTASPG
jgi:hypothetical protein